MQITFDTSKISSSASDSDIYVTFAAATAELTYLKTGESKPEEINFSGGSITIDKEAYGTSKAYSLADINSNTLTLKSATSLIAFISYGHSKGIEKLPVGHQPNFLSNDVPRYSVFEVSYSGTGGGADITNISQFGGSIKLEFKDGNTTQSYVANTLDTTKMFQALASASGFSGTTSTDCVYLDSSGEFQRIIGTNLFPNGSQQNPYPSYNAYLQSLYTSKGSGNSIVKKLTNLAPKQSPGGTGSFGFKSSEDATNVTADTIYNLDYHFDAYVTQVTAPDGDKNPNGTYSVKLTGHVNATIASPDGSDVKSYTYDELSIEIAADNLTSGQLYMTNFIYQAATSGDGISVSMSGWEDLNNDFGSANVKAALKLKAAGDFAQGMTCGFVGSTTTSTSDSSKQLGELTSYEWWKNPNLAYEPAQPTNKYYSVYGNAVSAHSDGKNGSSFSRGGVYGSPYDDRFGLNLIAPDANTSNMHITLLADGDLNPKSNNS